MKRLLFFFLLVALAGCGTDSAETTTSTQNPHFHCTIAYRQSVTAPIEDETTIVLANPEERIVDFEHLQLIATYATEPPNNNISLLIDVNAPDIGAEITRDLYQLKRGVLPANQFAGDHGFSGLKYIYHPIGGDELQYFCSVVTQ